MSMSSTNETIPTRRLTGWHVLFIVSAFFGTVFTANAAMVYYALGSFPGTSTKSSYQASQTYNAEIAAAVAQDRRGWNVGEKIARDADGHAAISVDAHEKTGAPLTGLSFTVAMEHPLRTANDHAVDLAEKAGASGLYTGAIEGLEPGQWDLVITGTQRGERVFLSRKRIVLH